MMDNTDRIQHQADGGTGVNTNRRAHAQPEGNRKRIDDHQKKREKLEMLDESLNEIEGTVKN